MLAIILGIFSSGGFGSILGLVGGYFNRKLDLQGKALDYADKDKDRAHDLNKQDKDLEFMKQEYAMRLQIADKETEKEIEVAGYEAMGKSYDFAKTSSEDGLVDKCSKVIRPFITLGFLFFTIYIFFEVQGIVTELGLQPKAEEVYALYKEIIEWVMFQAGVCIGWWFAMRPGKHPVKNK